MNKTNIIIAFIIGMVIASAGFHAYKVYQIEKVVNQNSQNIQQIINFLNQQVQGSQQTPQP